MNSNPNCNLHGHNSEMLKLALKKSDPLAINTESLALNLVFLKVTNKDW